MTTVRLLPFETLPGPTNMAADEILLDAAVAGVASIRFYDWSVPTLSLGYFQPFAIPRADPLLAKLSVVRRSTGGGAIVHHHDLTYCIGIPATLIGDEPWGCKMHHLIANVLMSFGVAANPVVCGEEKQSDPVLCFHHHTAGDLAVGLRTAKRDKIVGSAQRKQHGAILQHGSALLGVSAFAPSLPGIRELSGIAIEPKRLAERIAREFAKVTGWTIQPTDWTSEELLRRGQIGEAKYANREWTEKR